MYQNCTDKRQGELVMERIRNTEIEEMYLNVPTAQINEGHSVSVSLSPSHSHVSLVIT